MWDRAPPPSSLFSGVEVPSENLLPTTARIRRGHRSAWAVVVQDEAAANKHALAVDKLAAGLLYMEAPRSGCWRAREDNIRAASARKEEREHAPRAAGRDRCRGRTRGRGLCQVNGVDSKVAKAEEKETALLEAGAREAQLTNVDQEDQLRAKEPSASHVSTASASASAGPTASVASQGSDVSDRVQAYITTQFGRLRDEIASEYDTNRSTERLANDECH